MRCFSYWAVLNRDGNEVLGFAVEGAKLMMQSQSPTTPLDASLDNVCQAIRKYWGYDSFLPLQAEAMNCVLGGRDSVVVLPTGGGKSLCFQAPAMCMDGLAVVVSPLISLMKDQVDALCACGVPAACINSSLSPDERQQVADDVRAGRLRLLYMAPERLVAARTLAFLQQSSVSFIAVDEAHCISAWGHDFRPEYRQLRILKEAFPNLGIHAYTATAIPRVRDDITEQLGLTAPEMLVGRFDRPNLVYKVERRHNRLRQIREVLDRHPHESGIVYCIKRTDVDETCAALTELGYRVLPYHAGMSDEDRRRNQEAFIQEKVETIVATVAFGMGIDKSNVRYVIHAGMPKSLESYQQESGRAGRDSLEAECCLLYSGGDYMLWKFILEKPAEEPADTNAPVEAQPIADQVRARESAQKSLTAMYNYGTGVDCRHRVLAGYFGQELDAENCGACDVCLGELDLLDDSLLIGQKILSCVVRLRQRFGGEYTAKVLKGSKEQRIIQNGHDQLSTWGILSDENGRAIRDWIEQLVAQDYLQKVGDYNVLQVTAAGRQLLHGEVTPRLLKPTETEKTEPAVAADSWEGVDRGLFEALRRLRKQKAQQQDVPPYVVFGDAALRDMARRRPSSLEGFLNVRGVGEKKCADYGEEFVDCMRDYCREHQLPMDMGPPRESHSTTRKPHRDKFGPSASQLRAFELFRQGCSIGQVAETMGRAASTTRSYLTAFLRHDKIVDPSPWVDDATSQRIKRAVEEVGMERLRPIFEQLDGTVHYDHIHIVVGCLRNIAAEDESADGAI